MDTTHPADRAGTYKYVVTLSDPHPARMMKHIRAFEVEFRSQRSTRGRLECGQQSCTFWRLSAEWGLEAIWRQRSLSAFGPLGP